MRVKIIANKTIHPQQMSIDKYIGQEMEAFIMPTGLVYGIEPDCSTFILLPGEYEIVSE